MSKNTKKILIIGFYGAPNVGDELMLETLLQYLSQSKKYELNILMCKEGSFVRKDFPNLKYIKSIGNEEELNRLVDYFDLILFGGGAIIDDTLYDNKNTDYTDLNTIFVEMSTRMLLKGKRVICLSLSSNYKLTNKFYINKLSYIIDKGDYFSLRDKNSFYSLSSSGINTSRIKLDYDISLANKDLKSSRRKRLNKREFNVGLNLICDTVTEIKFNQIVDSILLFLERENIKEYSINLIPFYMYKENDLEYYIRLSSKKKYEGKMKILEMPTDTRTLKDTIMSQDLMICMRYHCALISLALGIPTLVISYDAHRHYPNKTGYLSELFGVDIYNFSSLNGIPYEVFENTLKLKTRNKGRKILKKARLELKANLRDKSFIDN